MKVLVLGPVDFSSDNAAMLRVDSLCNAMLADGHLVVAQSCYPCPTERLGSFKYEVRIPESVSRSIFEKILTKLGIGYRNYFSIARNRFEAFDVIYCYDTSLSWVISAKIISKISNSKLVFDVTELYDLSGMFSSVSSLRSRIGSWLGFLLAVVFADSVAVPSRFSCKIFSMFGHKAFLIPPFFADLGRYKDADNVLGNVKFCYAGIPGRKEKIDLIIESFVQFNSKSGAKSELHLVGISEDDIKRDFFKSDCMPDGIYAHGRIPVSAARAIVSKCNYLVVMRENTIRIRYGFPSKVAEAMCLGVPVIVNGFSDLPFYVINGENGFIVNSTSIPELMKVFEIASSTSDKKWRKMSTAARATYASFFSRDANMEKIRNLIAKPVVKSL